MKHFWLGEFWFGIWSIHEIFIIDYLAFIKRLNETQSGKVNQ